MTEERRAYSRVPSSLRGRLRILPSPDAPPLFRGFGLPDSPVTEQDMENSHLPEKLISFLLALDAKVNAVLTHMQEGRLEDDFPVPIHVSELSGAGLRIHPLPELKENDYVELLLYVEEFPLKLASGIAKVLRNEKNQGAQALQFIHILDEDLEKVIQRVFLEERRLLRAHRLE